MAPKTDSEFEEAKRLANLYSRDLRDAYQNPDHLKRKRLDLIIQRLKNAGYYDEVFSIGCGAAVVEIEIARQLNKRVIGIDCSDSAVELARELIEKAVTDGMIRRGQVEVLKDDLMKMSASLKRTLPMPLVICIDVIAAFSLWTKKAFLQKAWSKCVASGGDLIFTALSCLDDSLADKYASGQIIRGELYTAPLYSENIGTYIQLINSLNPRPERFRAIRLDNESLFIDLKKVSKKHR
jgi:cyclopropane fatty-acyl-phospholipid synthase-like methyltransferase